MEPPKRSTLLKSTERKRWCLDLSLELASLNEWRAIENAQFVIARMHIPKSGTLIVDFTAGSNSLCNPALFTRVEGIFICQQNNKNTKNTQKGTISDSLNSIVLIKINLKGGVNISTYCHCLLKDLINGYGWPQLFEDKDIIDKNMPITMDLTYEICNPKFVPIFYSPENTQIKSNLLQTTKQLSDVTLFFAKQTQF